MVVLKQIQCLGHGIFFLTCHALMTLFEFLILSEKL